MPRKPPFSVPEHLSFKEWTKDRQELLHFHGLRYPKFMAVNSGHLEWADDLTFPLFTKPLNLDASLGIREEAIVHTVKDLMERILDLTLSRAS